MKKTIFGVAAFAVFATAILLLSQLAQPVSVQAMDQEKGSDQLEREAKAFEEELKPFVQDLNEDEELTAIVEKLISDPEIRRLIREIQQTDVEEAEKRITLGQELCDYLEDEANTDAQEVQTVLTEKYGELFSKIKKRQEDMKNDIESGELSEEALKKQMAQKMEAMDLEKNPGSEIDWEQLISTLINITILVIGAAAVVLAVVSVLFLMGFCAGVGAVLITVVVAAIVYVLYKIFYVIASVTAAILVVLIGVIVNVIDAFIYFFRTNVYDNEENIEFLPKRILSINANALLNVIFRLLEKLKKAKQVT